ncbi:MAG: hypothetical protein LBG67_05070 [Campylobacteraceae bacterium]|jgi:hypothetical protein|nr:hypothetical protein [Campylobacteraceae bacterium]
MSKQKIRVKVISKLDEACWIRQFPSQIPIWGDCKFIFDTNEENYDWVVVYDDLSRIKDERFSKRTEKLTCRKDHSLLVTTEPPSIKSYGKSYVEQFGYVLTSHEDWALKHPETIFSQPALMWFYGFGWHDGIARKYDDILKDKHIKTEEISTVCSSKQQKHTLHNLRYKFTCELKKLIPEIDMYGHGVKEISDKADALDNYKYHIAIENYSGKNHWTEKLSDPFLGLCLPFYYGATNVEDYFPKDSFIEIDIYDVEKSAKIIKEAIKNNEYEKRLEQIKQAQELVLNRYNFFATVAKIIEEKNDKVSANKKANGVISSRRVLMTKSLKNFLIHGYEKIKLGIIRRKMGNTNT